jgi:hypothetical protein
MLDCSTCINTQSELGYDHESEETGGVALGITRRIHNSQVINDALVRLEGGENSNFKKEDVGGSDENQNI